VSRDFAGILLKGGAGGCTLRGFEDVVRLGLLRRERFQRPITCGRGITQKWILPIGPYGRQYRGTLQ